MNKTAYKVCSLCSGSGLEDGLYGPVACWGCKGNVMVRVRNRKGQYAVIDLQPDDSKPASGTPMRPSQESV